MTVDIRVPSLGESVTEAIVGQWFRKKGESIRVDEPLVELETDKVTVEVPAPVSGTVTEISVRDGETVEVGALLGSIAEGEVGGTVISGGPEPIGCKPERAQTPPAPEVPPEAKPKPRGDGGELPPTPAAAKMLSEAGLSAEEGPGTGKRGQVLKEDVLAALGKIEREAPEEAPPPAAPSAPAPAPAPAAEVRAPSPADDTAREERVRMSKLRQTIARRLKDAQNTAAMLTTFNEVDMSRVMALRSEFKELFEKKHGVKLGFMGFFVKAVIQALRDIPSVNAEIDGTDLIYKNYYHIGVAVGTEKGLVVPVVRNADSLNLTGIEKAINDLAKRARDGELKIEELQGGTFTISNGGIYGSLMSTPILNAPQSGILGMHKIEDRPVAIDGKVEIRPMMYLALSYDHRIVDGKGAVTFLVRVKEALEDPRRLLMDL
ncbi:MAG TPA: 2-oxoglutarate dehydrogenase complex dihydrolipoyllysine-residue succinyltransferase [Hyphomicrobiales bacterium]|nr:2-oxoglutarate dehydrogenase complex dihydrolipoyllysine-residue succinyltransferase [Hyphomicrobiales bacterium]